MTPINGEPPAPDAPASDAPGVLDLTRRGVAHRVIHPGHVTSVAEAAAACGVRPDQVVKTLVVRRGEDDYVLVLVPGDRSLSWPKLRALLGVNRMTLPDADEALAATGYARGTITPLGLDLPVIADERIRGGEITLGTGQRNTVVALEADSVIDAYSAIVADERIVGGEITLGTGQRNTVAVVSADDVIGAYAAIVADVTTDASSQ